MVAVAMLQREPGVLARVSNAHQLAGELVCLAHRHGHRPALADDPELVEAAVKPDSQSETTLARLDEAGRVALAWLSEHVVPDGHELLVAAADTDHDLLLILAPRTSATGPAGPVTVGSRQHLSHGAAAPRRPTTAGSAALLDKASR
ncbi:hypothetical protein [Amycolatopsis australiensis]|uniref:Uncharacterized protein n=1 Tax=Amycolatopsis australiensis TaxID=546364 RepID=A0A1K1LSB5_9PSEU|nr:hypothetical protein [Amycolatopsis australiensis]SFW13728.1 hypothetical protein SAMN04489730_0183 [Amycolatopsis australiensis]